MTIEMNEKESATSSQIQGHWQQGKSKHKGPGAGIRAVQTTIRDWIYSECAEEPLGGMASKGKPSWSGLCSQRSLWFTVWILHYKRARIKSMEISPVMNYFSSPVRDNNLLFIYFFVLRREGTKHFKWGNLTPQGNLHCSWKFSNCICF